MSRNKLIIQHVLKRVLLRIEHTRELNSEIQRIGIEYVKLTEKEITQEKEYKELMSSICELIDNVGCMVACGNRTHTLSIYDNANRKQEL